MGSYNGTTEDDVLDPLDSADDYMFGDAGNDIIYGWDGHDHIDGWTGDDTLYGEAGNDTLLGYEGNDYLAGGDGDDYLTGEAGADTFFFSSPFEGIDTIADFNYSENDVIEISEYGFGATSTDQFTYDNNTGALFYEQTQFAQLETNLGIGFVPSLDIALV